MFYSGYRTGENIKGLLSQSTWNPAISDFLVTCEKCCRLCAGLWRQPVSFPCFLKRRIYCCISLGKPFPKYGKDCRSNISGLMILKPDSWSTLSNLHSWCTTYSAIRNAVLILSEEIQRSLISPILQKTWISAKNRRGGVWLYIGTWHLSIFLTYCNDCEVFLFQWSNLFIWRIKIEI